MNAAPATEADLAELAALKERQGDPYPLPSGNLAGAVVVRNGGRVVAGAVAVRAVEIVMVLDHGWASPAWRFEAVKAMQAALERDLTATGIDCAYVWLEPRRARGFGRKLMERLGWSRPTWDCYQRKASDV